MRSNLSSRRASVTQSISLWPPATRMVVIRIDRFDDGELPDHVTTLFPVLAIEARILSNGTMVRDVLINDQDDHCGIHPLSELRNRWNRSSLSQLVVCDWPACDDAQRFAAVADDMLFEVTLSPSRCAEMLQVAGR